MIGAAHRHRVISARGGRLVLLVALVLAAGGLHAETGATFTVDNALGEPVLTRPIGANLGSWSSTYSNVYALDFDGVTTAGS